MNASNRCDLIFEIKDNSFNGKVTRVTRRSVPCRISGLKDEATLSVFGSVDVTAYQVTIVGSNVHYPADSRATLKAVIFNGETFDVKRRPQKHGNKTVLIVGGV